MQLREFWLLCLIILVCCTIQYARAFQIENCLFKDNEFRSWDVDRLIALRLDKIVQEQMENRMEESLDNQWNFYD